MPVGSTTTARYWSEQVWRLASAALDLLFPPRCVVCRRPDVSLCVDCISAFERIQGPICPTCGDAQPSPTVCHHCRNGRRFQSVRSAFRFAGGIQQAVHALKYKQRSELAVPLARAMSGVLPSPGPAALCAVPLHPTRLAQRGYNQSMLIAEQLAGVWANCELLPDSALVRTRDTASQVELDYGARQTNVQEAFCADVAWVAHREVTLIDDVCTTGATLDACAAALLDAGAASVRAITLARAV